MTYYKKIPKLLRKIIQSPELMGDVYTYFKNDLLALAGRYNYDYRLLFIAGLPKSGTTWVETQIKTVPGYNMRLVNDPDNCVIDHNICDAVFSSLPGYGYSILKLHTKYTEHNLDVIKRYTPKFIVMIRDLRDMCVSRYFHVRNEDSHRHHRLYKESSFEDGMMHCIEVIADEYVPWVRDWMVVAKANPDMILIITYEGLNRSPAATFKKIFDFFHLPYDDIFMEKIAKSKLLKEQNIKEVLKKNIGVVRSTSRKGIIGDWKNCFSPAHKENFKKAGGELLINLGYEKDLNW